MKTNLKTISSGYYSTTLLNGNFDKLEIAIDNTLSRDGTTPNEMNALIDMNSYRIINLPDPVDGGDAVTLDYANNHLGGNITVEAEAARDAAIQAKDEAEDARDAALVSETNAGVSATNAAQSEDLAEKWAENPEDVAVTTGHYSALHWAAKAQLNATTGDYFVFSGTLTSNQAAGVDPITLPADPKIAARVMLSIGGIWQIAGTDFTLGGTTTQLFLTGASGLTGVSYGGLVQIPSGLTNISAPSAGSVTTTSIQNSAITTTKIATGAVTASKIASGVLFPRNIFNGYRDAGNVTGVADFICNKTYINQGSAYNTTTGIYTVPETGIYEITVSVSAPSGTSPSYLKVYVNGVDTNFGGYGVTAGVGHNLVTLSLNSGDLVKAVAATSTRVIQGDSALSNGFSIKQIG